MRLPNVGAGMEMPSLVHGDVPVQVSATEAAITRTAPGREGRQGGGAFGNEALERFSLALGVRRQTLQV